MTTPPPDIIIIRYGEISLKTPYVRTLFETRLIHNIHHPLQQQGIPHTISKQRGRIYLHTTHIPQSLPILAHTSGIVSYSPAHQTTTDLPTLTQTTLTIATPLLTPPTSFALRVTRTGTHPYTSQDAATHIGAAVATATHAPVDLTTPNQEIHIEIRGNNAYLFTQKTRGIGGLPVGTQGTIAILITHTSDILAAWYMMHRGCTILPLLTNTTLEHTLTRFLDRWHLDTTPIPLDPTTPDFPTRLTTILTQTGCDALATGASLNDPTTLNELTHLKSITNLPLLTPIIALTSQEITIQCEQKEITP
jgi:tRNA uracil 4-sulfurtransferase